MLRSIVFVVPVPLLVSSLAAQAAAIETATDVEAWINVMAYTWRSTIPANTAISTPQTVSRASGGCSASTTIQPIGSFGMDWLGSSTAIGQFPDAQSAGINGDVNWSLAGSGRGWLAIDAFVHAGSNAGSSLTVTGPAVSVALHVRDGYPPERHSSRRFVSFANGIGLSCGLRSSAFTVFSNPATSGGHLRIDFTPALPPVAQVTYGDPCGATLSVTDTTTLTSHDVRLAFTGGFPSATVIYLFGIRRASVPIQGSPCRLYTDPVAALARTSNDAGAASLSFALPGPLQSAPILVQGLTFDDMLQIRATTGVEMQFVD